MDFRLINETRRWMEEEGLLGDCDVVSVAGASKEIASGSEGGKELLLKQINLSNMLHGAVNIFLLHHSDCGAYKSAYQFASPEEEKAKQLEEMFMAESIIKAKLPNVNIIKVWAEMKDGDGKKVEFSRI